MKIRRIGHSFFRFESQSGKTIVVDPWFGGNPTLARDWSDPDKFADTGLLLLTHGHFDHSLGVEDILKAAPKAMLVAQFELALSYIFKGYGAMPLNAGGTIEWEGIKVTAINAAHTSSFSDMEKKTTTYLGSPLGYVITFEDGYKVYIAGDTGITSEMKFVLGDLIKPDLAILPVDGLFAMDPEQAIHAASLIGCKTVIPCHDFKRPEDSPDKNAMEAFLAQNPFVSQMLYKGEEFASQLSKRQDLGIKAAVLGYGDAIDI